MHAILSLGRLFPQSDRVGKIEDKILLGQLSGGKGTLVTGQIMDSVGPFLYRVSAGWNGRQHRLYPQLPGPKTQIRQISAAYD